MSSEVAVVLALIVIGIGFIVWVRKNSHDYDRPEQAGNPGEENSSIRNTK